MISKDFHLQNLNEHVLKFKIPHLPSIFNVLQSITWLQYLAIISLLYLIYFLKAYFRQIPASTSLSTFLVRPTRPLPRAFLQPYKISFRQFKKLYELGTIDFKEDTTICELHQLVDFRIGWRDWIDKFQLDWRKSLVSEMEAIQKVYGYGEDFYATFLGDPLVFSTGLFDGIVEEDLEDAQLSKMKQITDLLDISCNDVVLDLTFQWATFATYITHDCSGAKAIVLPISTGQQTYINQVTTYIPNLTVLPPVRKEIFPLGLPANATKLLALNTFDYFPINSLKCLLESFYINYPYLTHILLELTTLEQSTPESLQFCLFIGHHTLSPFLAVPLTRILIEFGCSHFQVELVENVGPHMAVTMKHWAERVKDRKNLARQLWGIQYERNWTLWCWWGAALLEKGCIGKWLVLLRRVGR